MSLKYEPSDSPPSLRGATTYVFLLSRLPSCHPLRVAVNPTDSELDSDATLKNVLCVRETKILSGQQTPQRVLVCDHAGLVINKLSQDMLDHLNSHGDYVSTSSCSGRVAVFWEASSSRLGGPPHPSAPEAGPSGSEAGLPAGTHTNLAAPWPPSEVFPSLSKEFSSSLLLSAVVSIYKGLFIRMLLLLYYSPA